MVLVDEDNWQWMYYLEEKEMITGGTRVDLLGNRIVLIAPRDTAFDRVRIAPGFDLAELIGSGRLSMGDPDHVPAGIYGLQALESLGTWSAVQSRVARAKDVRAALALVERGEAPVGVVYATDAAISTKVKIVGTFGLPNQKPKSRSTALPRTAVQRTVDPHCVRQPLPGRGASSRRYPGVDGGGAGCRLGPCRGVGAPQ